MPPSPEEPISRYGDEFNAWVIGRNPTKIPTPLRNEIMHMLLVSWEKLQIDTEKEFKLLFVINALDGSEVYLVSDKLYALIGDEMLKFRKHLSRKKVKTTERNKSQRKCWRWRAIRFWKRKNTYRNISGRM